MNPIGGASENSSMMDGAAQSGKSILELDKEKIIAIERENTKLKYCFKD